MRNRSWRSLHRARLLALITAVGAASVVAGPAAPALAGECIVGIEGSLNSWSVAQDAIDAADPGDVLVVDGYCDGPLLVEKNLTIRGGSTTRPWAEITGNDTVRVLEIGTGAKVTLKNLVILHGKATGPDLDTGAGGGILNRGTLTLRSVDVQTNAARIGGGIATLGPLTMLGTTIVQANTAIEDGGGVLVSDGLMTMAGSATIASNTAAALGGGLLIEGPGPSELMLVMRGASSIRDNTAARAGGAFLAGLKVTLEDTATIAKNTASNGTGGLQLSNATLVLSDKASIKGNVGDVVGGIYADRAKLVLQGDSVVSGNKGSYAAGIGLASGTITLKGHATITKHKSPALFAVVMEPYPTDVATLTLKEQSTVTGNSLAASGGAVIRSTCVGGAPTVVGGKTRVKGNTPRNITTGCPTAGAAGWMAQ